jgi:CRISPR/Cas system-associated protein Csm6
VGRKVDLTPEEQRLVDLIRQAHEAMTDLKAVIREARALQPALVAGYEATHHREIKQLSNFFQSEMNRQSAELNAAVRAARSEITDQLAMAELVIDRDTKQARLLFSGRKFDDQIPLPYPDQPVKETDQ